MPNAIIVDERDNVATALADLENCSEAEGITLLQAVPFGHKFALKDIGVGEPVIKYGEVIGMTTAAIAVGEHVHVHNVDGLRGRGDRK